MTHEVVIDGDSLTVEQVSSVATDRARVAIAPRARQRAATTRAVVDKLVASGAVAYGVTTGFGKLSEVAIPPDRLAELQVNLVRSHAAGVGDLLPEREVRAMMLLRANVIAKGFSGARIDLADLLVGMLNADLYPPVPEQGSVGASGDLAPLAHLALSLIGEGALRRGTAQGSANNLLRAAGLEPITLASKEGLTLINGTQAHTAIAALALVDARRLWRAAHVAGAMSLEALLGTPVAFDERIQSARGQVGQAASAAYLRLLLAESEIRESHRYNDPRVQDAYALRCMPQVHGPVLDAIEFAAGVIGRELNAATDNPLVFDTGDLLSGGNFHGQSVAMVLDFLAIALTNLATISERRIDRLVHPDLNQGLPAFLTADAGREFRLHDGAGHGGGDRQRVQGALAPGERRHDPDGRQQGRRRPDGDGGGVEAAPHRAQRAIRARDRAHVRGAGDRLPRAAQAGARRGPRARSRAQARRAARARSRAFARHRAARASDRRRRDPRSSTERSVAQ